MYRLLVVDDEPYTADGLYELFSDQADLPLDVGKAYSAMEAIEALARNRLDIVLTDIEMPEMNGIELQQHIRRQWPRCKVIFLTGYDQFAYIQSSLRQGAVDYVLKTEGDKPILAAVRKAMDQLAEELSVETIRKEARDQMHLAAPLLQKEFVLELLQGEGGSAQATDAKFRELGLPLQAASPVLLLLGRVDHWREEVQPNDRPLLLYSIQNIVHEYLSASVQLFGVNYERDRLLWLIQPKQDSEENEEKEDNENFEEEQHPFRHRPCPPGRIRFDS